MSKKHYIIPIFVPDEGCPHRCVFCNQNRITGSEELMNVNIARNIIEEHLDTIDRSSAFIEISFFGGTFTAIREERQKKLLALAKEYKDSGKIDYIHLSTRPDAINDYILTYLKEFGVNVIELGVQSLNEEVLKASGRGHSIEDVYNASKLIKDYGFILGHQLMLGLPKDNFERDRESLKASISMKPDIARLYPALVIKDTPMEKMYNRGYYKPYTLDEGVEISLELLREYEKNNIKVIRVGLQPTENINTGKDLIAGPFHPAFRELVESKDINNKIYELLKDQSGKVIIEVSNKDVSKLYSNRKKYFQEMNRKLNNIIFDINVRNDIEKGKISIYYNENKKILNI